MRTAKTLIRLGGCPGWSESSLGAQSLCWFCNVVAHIVKGTYSNCLQYKSVSLVDRLVGREGITRDSSLNVSVGRIHFSCKLREGLKTNNCVLKWKRGKVFKMKNFRISYVVSHCTKWRQFAKSNIKDGICASNVDVYKSIDKMLIPDRNVLPRNVMETNFGASWGFSSKHHVHTARKFHCLNMTFVVWTLLLVDWTIASNSYAHRYLCKNKHLLFHLIISVP